MTAHEKQEIGVLCPHCNMLTIRYDEYEFNKKKTWSEFNKYHYVDTTCINPECESNGEKIRLCLGHFAKKYYKVQAE
jgi:hypothetical protein